MTEPEELDEDLFADLDGAGLGFHSHDSLSRLPSYDADEPTTTTIPPTQPKPDPEPVQSTPSNLAQDPPADVKEDNNENGPGHVPDEEQNVYVNGQDDRETSRWDNDGRGSRMDVAVEQDSGSIGIKEDGGFIPSKKRVCELEARLDGGTDTSRYHKTSSVRDSSKFLGEDQKGEGKPLYASRDVQGSLYLSQRTSGYALHGRGAYELS
ncbi:MAG: hypothetical protein Q9176_004178 [Flavoplaca citrina]